MDYKEYPDSELYMMVCENSEEAKDILFNKYNYILKIVVRRYLNAARENGVDSRELYSEALLGFTDAINNYKDDKGASFPTFLTLCLDRRLTKTINSSKAIKNKMISESYSLDTEFDSGVSLLDMIVDETAPDPLNSLSQKEKCEELVSLVKKELSDSELEVFELMINGYSYNEIADLLNKNVKQVDNAMQRIKGKVKNILKQMD